MGDIGAVRRMGIGGDMTRRGQSVSSAAGVLVDKEFVYEKKNADTEEYLARKDVSQRLRKRLVVEILAVVSVLFVVAFLLFFVLL